MSIKFNKYYILVGNVDAEGCFVSRGSQARGRRYIENLCTFHSVLLCISSLEIFYFSKMLYLFSNLLAVFEFKIFKISKMFPDQPSLSVYIESYKI